MNEIDKYFEYQRSLPQLFKFNENINIITNKEEMLEYAGEENCKLGVVYENDYLSLIVDLIQNSTGTRYTYARIVNRNSYDGVVVIPLLKDKIVFVRQFRHGTREYELELPRGFSEKSGTVQENAEREIYEELGASAKNMKYIGSVIGNSGLSGGLVHVYACEIDRVERLSTDEGIEGTIQLSLKEIESLIAENTIRDCFTLSAIYKFIISEQVDRSCENVSRSI